MNNFCAIKSYYETIVFYVKQNKFDKGLKACEEAFRNTNSYWFYCLEAEIYILKKDYKLAVERYKSIIGLYDSNFDYHVYLQLNIIYRQSGNDDEVIRYSEQFFEKYPTTSAQHLFKTYLLYQIYIESLVNNRSIGLAHKLIEQLKDYEIAEFHYLEIALKYATADNSADALYKGYYSKRPFHACGYHIIKESKEINNLKNCFYKAFEDELDAVGLLCLLEEVVRNEIKIYSELRYRAHLKIRVKPIRQHFAFISEHSNSLFKLVQGKNIHSHQLNVEADRWYIQIYYASDRWYGDYLIAVHYLYQLMTEVEDTQFYLSEDYDYWVDQFLIKDGIPSFTRFNATSEFYDDKLLLMEKIASNQPDNNALKLILSDEYLAYGKIGLKKKLNDDFLNEEDQEDFEKSIKEIKKALQYNPDNREACLWYGKVLFHKNEPKHKFYFSKAATIDYPESWYYLAQIAVQEGEVVESTKFLKKVLKQENEHSASRKLKIKAAELLRMLIKKNAGRLALSVAEVEVELCLLYKKRSQANIAYKKLLNKSSYKVASLRANLVKLNKEIVEDSENSAIWIQMGHNHYHLEEFIKAAEMYKKALELGVSDVSVTNWHILSLVYSGESQSALEALTLKLNNTLISEDKALLMGTQAWVYDYLGDEKKALEIIAELLKWDKNHYSNYLMACIYARNNQLQKALLIVRKIIKADPSQKNKIREEPDFENLQNQIDFWDLVN